MSNRESDLLKEDETLRHEAEHLKYERDSIDDYKKIQELTRQIDDIEDRRSEIHRELDYISKET